MSNRTSQTQETAPEDTGKSPPGTGEEAKVVREDQAPSGCQDAQDPCGDLRDCIGKMEFVRSDGRKKQDPRPRRGGRQPSGDCAVVALSLAAGLTYTESRRRLAMVNRAIRNSGPELQAMGEEWRPHWTSGIDRDPLDGVSNMNLTLVMRFHGFRVQAEPECLAAGGPPRVTAGATQEGTGHALFTRKGQAVGSYDPTGGKFRPLMTWTRDQTPDTVTLLQLQRVFGSQELIDLEVRTMLQEFAARPLESG